MQFCQIIDTFPGFECLKQFKEKKIVIQEAFSEKKMQLSNEQNAQIQTQNDKKTRKFKI